MRASIPGLARCGWSLSACFTKIPALILSFTARKSRSSGARRTKTIQDSWSKTRRVVVWRLVGMLKCKVLHTHMIRVLKQKERIPNVVRCLGSPIHKYGGLLGVVVLFVGFSICLWVSSDKISNKREWG